MYNKDWAEVTNRHLKAPKEEKSDFGYATANLEKAFAVVQSSLKGYINKIAPTTADQEKLKAIREVEITMNELSPVVYNTAINASTSTVVNINATGNDQTNTGTFTHRFVPGS